MDLDSLLNDKVAIPEMPSEPVAEAPSPQSGNVAETQAVVTGEAASVQTDAVDAPPSIVDREKQGLISALTATRQEAKEARERTLRLEAELEDFKRRTHQPPQQPAKQPHKWTEDEVLKDLPGSFERQQQLIEERIRQDRIDQSVAMAQEMFSDHADVMKHWNDATREQPWLLHHALNAQLPGVAAYKAAKQYMAAKQAMNPAEMEARINAEADKRAQAKFEQLRASIATEGVPKSLTSARGSGAATPSAAPWKGPPSLDELLAPRARARH